MLCDQSDALCYDFKEEIGLFVTLREVIAEPVGETIEAWSLILSDAGPPELFQAIDRFSKEITLERGADEALDHLLHLIDGVVDTIDLAIFDHGLEVSDWIDTGDLLLRLVVIIVLAHLEPLSLLLFNLLLELLLLSCYQVFPINASLLLGSAAFYLFHRLKVKLLVEGRDLLLRVHEHLAIWLDVLFDRAVERWQ